MLTKLFPDLGSIPIIADRVRGKWGWSYQSLTLGALVLLPYCHYRHPTIFREDDSRCPHGYQTSMEAQVPYIKQISVCWRNPPLLSKSSLDDFMLPHAIQRHVNSCYSGLFMECGGEKSLYLSTDAWFFSEFFNPWNL